MNILIECKMRQNIARKIDNTEKKTIPSNCTRGKRRIGAVSKGEEESERKWSHVNEEYTKLK